MLKLALSLAHKMRNSDLITLRISCFNSKMFTLQYIASASGEIYNLLIGNSQLTLAAIMKLIDLDFLPQENAEWAKNVTAKARHFLEVVQTKSIIYRLQKEIQLEKQFKN